MQLPCSLSPSKRRDDRCPPGSLRTTRPALANELNSMPITRMIQIGKGDVMEGKEVERMLARVRFDRRHNRKLSANASLHHRRDCSHECPHLYESSAGPSPAQNRISGMHPEAERFATAKAVSAGHIQGLRLQKLTRTGNLQWQRKLPLSGASRGFRMCSGRSHIEIVVRLDLSPLEGAERTGVYGPALRGAVFCYCRGCA